MNTKNIWAGVDANKKRIDKIGKIDQNVEISLMNISREIFENLQTEALQFAPEECSNILTVNSIYYF